jgi:hypothetical protein
MTPEITAAPTATAVPAQTPVGTFVQPTVAHNQSSFGKFMSVIAALEPLILAGASPFVKNSMTGTIIASEAPLAQTLLQVLSNL